MNKKGQRSKGPKVQREQRFKKIDISSINNTSKDEKVPGSKLINLPGKVFHVISITSCCESTLKINLPDISNI